MPQQTPLQSGTTRRSVLARGAAALFVGAVGNGAIPRVYAATGAESPMPEWLRSDVATHKSWLPEPVRRLGIQGAAEERMKTFERIVNDVGVQSGELNGLNITFSEIQNNIQEMNVPTWMVALSSSAANQQIEIIKQLHFMSHLAGPAPATPVSKRNEQLLMFAGAAQMLTPNGLGSEGCTAALSKYVLSQVKLEAATLKTDWISNALATTQGSAQMKSFLIDAAKKGHVEMQTVPFLELTADHIRRGDFVICEKPGGTHCIAFTGVPAGWNSEEYHWDPNDKMAIANTGLPEFGLPHMCLAQEFISLNLMEAAPDLKDYNKFWVHNDHGAINSHYVVFDRKTGDILLDDPRTNVYFVKGAAFNIFSFN